VSCDREQGPGLGYEPQTGKQEDRKRNPVELKPINRDDLAQHCMASLKDTEDPEIDEPEKFRAGIILKRSRSQFGAKCGGKKREGSEKLQLKKTVHETTSPTPKDVCLAYAKTV
jgi:hypothetical protein